MSEKNTTCPNCEIKAQEKKKTLIAKAEKAYGKVSADDYVELRDKSKERIYLKDTLHQVFSTYLNECSGELTLAFKCECSVCGFIYNLNKKINIMEDKC